MGTPSHAGLATRQKQRWKSVGRWTCSSTTSRAAGRHVEIFAEEPTADTSHTTKTTCQSSPLHLISNCDIMTLDRSSGGRVSEDGHVPRRPLVLQGGMWRYLLRNQQLIQVILPKRHANHLRCI